MKKSIIGVTLGIASGIVAGVLLTKWLKHLERKQLDMEIRLDLMEYNHLHEDEHLRVIL